MDVAETCEKPRAGRHNAHPTHVGATIGGRRDGLGGCTAHTFLPEGVVYPCDRCPPSGKSRPMTRSWGFKSAVYTLRGTAGGGGARGMEAIGH